MPNPTLRQLISTFTEQELDLNLPLNLQDVSAEDLELVDQYNAYIANKDYQTAYDFRLANPQLEKYIIDAKKLNTLIMMWINAYLFAQEEKTAANISYDNNSGIVNAATVQTALDTLGNRIDVLVNQLNDYTILAVDALPATKDQNTIYLVKEN